MSGRRWSIATLVNWRRYLIVLAAGIPLTFVLIVLDATVGIALEWTWYPIGLAYGIVGVWWSLPEEER